MKTGMIGIPVRIATRIGPERVQASREKKGRKYPFFPARVLIHQQPHAATAAQRLHQAKAGLPQLQRLAPDIATQPGHEGIEVGVVELVVDDRERNAVAGQAGRAQLPGSEVGGEHHHAPRRAGGSRQLDIRHAFEANARQCALTLAPREHRDLGGRAPEIRKTLDQDCLAALRAELGKRDRDVDACVRDSRTPEPRVECSIAAPSPSDAA